VGASGPRRGHGEDSIYFDRANSCYVGAVSLGHEAGKRHAAVAAPSVDSVEQNGEPTPGRALPSLLLSAGACRTSMVLVDGFKVVPNRSGERK